MTETRYFALQGGLDLVSPAIVTPAGRAIAAVNYEPHPRGYQRVAGYERFDGRPKPSDASYWVLRFDAGAAAVAEGETVTGAVSGATGEALIEAVAQSGAYGDGDAAGYLVLSAVAGTFQDNEPLQVAAVTRCVADGDATERGALNDTDDSAWLQDAIETARAAIQTVPGSGAVRGVWIYQGEVYAFRDNAGGIAGVMHKATASGWVAQALGRELAFSAGGLRELAFSSGGTYQIQVDDVIEGAQSTARATIRQVILESGTWAGGDAAGRLLIVDQTAISFGAESLNVGTDTDVATLAGDSSVLEIAEGDTITGEISGASATITRVVLERGDWSTHDAAGRLIFASQSGTFQDETIKTGDQSSLATIAGDASAVTLPPGGCYQFVNHNFFGASDLERMYGVNGQGQGFEWDGSVFVSIATGMSDDRPTRVTVHRNHLFFAFRGGSLQHSSTGNPYQWQVLTGAGEIGLGEETTDLLGSVAGALAVFGRDQVGVLFGDDSSNWDLKTLASDAGAVAWTAQAIGVPIYLDNRGLRSLETTERFGDFVIGTVTQMVEPIFRAKRAAGVTAVGSLRVRAKDQYRLYFSDGTGLTVYFGRAPAEILPFDLGMTVTCTASGKDSDGEEVLLAGNGEGMVYEFDAGTSFDGGAVSAFLRLPFNHVGSPAQKKRWQKAVLEVDASAQNLLGLTAEFSYADPNQPPAIDQNFVVRGRGGFWAEDFWDQFYWSAPVEGLAEADLDGLGRNISLTVISDAVHEDLHVIHGVTLYFSYRGLAR